MKQTGLESANANRWGLGLDVLLLAVLAIPHLWFNPVSSAFFISLIAIYVGTSLRFPQMPDEMTAPHRRDYVAFRIRLWIVILTVLVVAILPTAWYMFQRYANGGIGYVHDGVYQTEAAIRFISQGKNPYVETYWNTPMADWQHGEPPWTDSPIYHNAYLPFLFVGSIPFYWVSNAILGWYDQRFVYLLAYLGVVFLLPHLVVSQRDKLVSLLIYGLNFLAVFFLAEGRNDIAIMAGLVLVSVLLARRHTTLSALTLGLTMAIKHQAWFFFPFYLCYLIPTQPTRQTWRALVWQVILVGGAAAVMIVPFFVWDARAFIDDTVLYLMNATEHGFPIKGWGFSTILLAIGVIPSADSAFPFGLLEIGFGLPVLAGLLYWQRRDNTLRRAWIGFAVCSFVIEYFSRFFNDNYVVFVLQVLAIGALMAPYRWNSTEDKHDGIAA